MSEEKIIRSPKPFYDIPDISVAAFVYKKLAELDGSLTCIVDATTDAELTVDELVTKSKLFARTLVDKGVQKSDLIITFAENSVQLVVAIFGGILLGSTVYPITPVANVHELDQLFDTLGQMVVITSVDKSKVFGKVLAKNKANGKVKLACLLDGQANEDYLSLDDLLDQSQAKDIRGKIPYFDVQPKQDMVLMLQSSGTSGVPKSMMISNRAFVASLHSFTDAPKFDDQLVSSILSPIACMSGFSCLVGYVLLGSKVVIYRDYDPELVMRAIEKYGIHFMLIVPAFGHKLVYGDLVDKYNLSTLSGILTTGAAFAGNIGRAIVDKYGVILQEVYGMTEYGALTLCPDIEFLEYISGNLGRPSHNTEIKVVDVNTGQSLGPDMDGEICVRGPKLFSGYLNNPEATREAIDSDGWFHTGDIGHYDSMTRLYITDRLKELIKWGTKQVSPSELELFLQRHPSVAEVAVIGVAHRTETQWPRAYVKCYPNKTVSEEELKKFVADNLSEHKQLRAGIVFVEHIRRTTVGKVDRRYYKQLVANELIDS